MHSIRRIARAAAWLAALTVAAGARGQTPPCESGCPVPANREIAERWAGQTGAPEPQVRVDADGTRRLEWHGAIGLRGQRNRVAAGGRTVTVGLQSRADAFNASVEQARRRTNFAAR
jgi:hypothetical protein